MTACQPQLPLTIAVCREGSLEPPGEEPTEPREEHEQVETKVEEEEAKVEVSEEITEDAQKESTEDTKEEVVEEVEAEVDASAEATEESELEAQVREKALELLEAWAALQEVFRIPKRERQAERIKHERAADLGWPVVPAAEERAARPDPARCGDLAALQQQARAFAALQLADKQGGGAASAPSTPSPQVDRFPRREEGERGGGASRGLSYNRADAYHSPGGALRGGYQGGRGRPEGGGGGVERRNLRLDDRTGRLAREHLHRDDRRQLFQAKVEEEQRQKVLRAALAARHTQCCRLLGLPAADTPLLPHYPDFYLAGGRWTPMPAAPHPEADSWSPPGMASSLPPEAHRPGDPPAADPRLVYPPGVCPEEPPPPSPPPPGEPEERGTFEAVCQYYDSLYFRGEAGEQEEEQGEGEEEEEEEEAVSRSPSPPVKRPRLAYEEKSASPSPLPSPSPPGSALALSPDYRSPSPAPRPAALVTPPLPPTPPEEEVLRAPASPSPPPAAPAPPLEARLQPKWRAVRDSGSRVYYYHRGSRAAQWAVPWLEGAPGGAEGAAHLHKIDTADTDTEDGGEDGEDTDTEEDSEDEEVEQEAKDEPMEDEQIPDSDLSASEKKMLLRMRGRTKEERTNLRKQKKERERERREQERLVSRERHTRHRRDGLVVEHLVPARLSDKDKVDLMTFKEMRERLLNKDKIREQQMKEEREEEEKEKKEERAKSDKVARERKRASDKAKREAELKQLASSVEAPPSSTPTEAPSSTTSSAKAKTTQAAADTSSDVEKKHKEKFVKEMSKVVVKILDPYRKKGVRGHIGNTTDFKHLAKKVGGWAVWW